MAIAISTIISQTAQAGGKTRVRERHTTDAGTVREFEYDADAGVDTAAVLAARATTVWQQILAEECQSFIDRNTAPAFRDATKAILVAYVRAAYQSGNAAQLVPIARWILNRITDGTVTDAQVQTAFGLTSGQYTTLKTQMQNLVAADSTIQTAVGA